MKTEIKKLEKSQLEIEFELTEEEFKKHVDSALLHLKEHVKADGFRPGQVPLEMVEKKVGQENLLMDAGDLAVKKSYGQFVKENNLEPIGEPEVQVLKIVPIAKQSRIHDGEAIGTKEPAFIFRVKISVLPELSLPDYKEIASKIESKQVLIEPHEVEDAVNYLQKSRAKFFQVDRPAENKDFVEIEYQNKGINNGKEIKDKFILGEGGFLKDFEDNVIRMKAGEEKEFTSKFPENTPRKDLAGKDTTFKVKMLSIQKMELPEINDEFAKSLGAFSSLAALKENLKEGIIMEKQEGEKQRKRGEILSKISDKIKFELPEKMVEYEEKRLFGDFKNQISQNANISFEGYLSSIKKTEEEIKKSFRLEAEKRIKNFLVLRAIGKAEKIEVSEEELNEEIQKLMKNYIEKPFNGAQGKQSQIDTNQLKEYSRGVIFNEKVFRLLENFSS